MPSLAARNLFQNKLRLTSTLTGIVFALVLMVVQLGLFLGFARTTSNIIDHSGADLWIASKGVPYFDVAAIMPERKFYQVMAVPGVAKAEKLIVRFSTWKKPRGGEETIEVVGFNPDTRAGGPWDLDSGDIEDLRQPDTVFIDESYRDKLGVSAGNELVEINGRRARVVGFTRGIRSFTTAPFVFTSFKNALNYARLGEDQMIYVLAWAVQGGDIQALKRTVAAQVSGIDVYTTAEFSRKTRYYWMFTTGAGIALLVAALMGFVVGIVVVAQTIYAATLDHLREFGTLKAMGASNTYVCLVIVKQACLSAALGYVPGIAIGFAVVRLGQWSGAPILLPWELAAGLFVLAFVMCIGASLISINKAMHIDPALVLKS